MARRWRREQRRDDEKREAATAAAAAADAAEFFQQHGKVNVNAAASKGEAAAVVKFHYVCVCGGRGSYAMGKEHGNEATPCD